MRGPEKVLYSCRDSDCPAPNAPERIEVAQVIQSEACAEHRPGGEKQNIRALVRMKVLPERGKRGDGVKQQNKPVGESRRKPKHESEQENKFGNADPVDDHGSKTREKIKMLINGNGMLRPHKFVDRPHEHDEKDSEAQNQQRDGDAVTIII
jgi:hypothetical protein